MLEGILTHPLVQLRPFKDEKYHSKPDHFLMNQIGYLLPLFLLELPTHPNRLLRARTSLLHRCDKQSWKDLFQGEWS